MTQVWERLFVGNLLDADSLAASNPHEITAVITVCDEEVRRKSPVITYLRFPIADCRPLERKQMDSILDAICENIRSGSVLVHCVGGSSRSPILTAAWMHIVGYRNIDDALIEIGKRRPIDPSPILLKSVMEHL
jgi:protein-tyrosine phosphatase